MPVSPRRGWFPAAFAGWLLLAAPLPAAAAPPTQADLQQAFEAVMADPTDLAANFKYAGIAVALGDYEAAISSYERLLIFDPRLTQAKLELGVLYFRLGSFEAARSYFEQAEADGPLSEADSKRIGRYIAAIERATSPHRYAAAVSGGLRYQTNANLAPGNTIRVGGAPTPLPPEFRERDDGSAFLNGRLRHRYDFGGQEADYWETNANVYVSRQFAVEEFDTSYITVNTGPRITLADESDIRLRPYITGSALALADSFYQGAGGAGAELTVPVGKDWSLELIGEWQYAGHESSPDWPSAEELNGARALAAATLTHRPVKWAEVSATVQGERVNASEDYEAYDGISLILAARADAPPPVDLAGERQNWTLLADATVVDRRYDSPNTAISPRTREDTELRLNAMIYAPVSASSGLFLGGGWRQSESTVPNYEFDNVTVLGGYSIRF